MKIKSLSLVALAVLTGFGSALVFAERDQLSPYVDAKGAISLPADFRLTLSHLGSWFVPSGDASGFHDVYVDAAGVEGYREDGAFPDGTIIVKELRASTAGDYTTGQGVHYANSELKQWFVMVKDTNGRFQGNDNWGDGWGWALFKTDSNGRNVSSNYKVDCLGCHIPAKDSDWIYVDAYPTLTSPE